jgi:hypothetical protein
MSSKNWTMELYNLKTEKSAFIKAENPNWTNWSKEHNVRRVSVYKHLQKIVITFSPKERKL